MRIARGGAAGEIAKLKTEPGREILAPGATQFVRSLIQLGQRAVTGARPGRR
jgi:hypothetical protein